MLRLLALLAALCSCARVDTLEAKVVGVVDGDTIDILDGAKKLHRIRLNGIDTPERGQPFFRRAKSALSDLVFGKTVKVDTAGVDKYDRTIGRIYVDGKDVGLAMLEAGMAWHYTKYDQSKKYADGEEFARAARRGLWIDKNAIPPWDWRKMPKAERKPFQQAITPETK
jgi:micrococcal nuclease